MAVLWYVLVVLLFQATPNLSSKDGLEPAEVRDFRVSVRVRAASALPKAVPKEHRICQKTTMLAAD
ncbi:MAG: hypothetical protein F6K50_05020 [Moorea sp. SIO3I7]|nr:hypothetical protein [Moorena sp. SIO3I7]